MAEKGWIVEKTGQEDKRFLRVYLSDKARAMKSTLLKERATANEEILQGSPGVIFLFTYFASKVLMSELKA